MKKKPQGPREIISVAEYREQSQFQTLNYQPQFIFEMINSRSSAHQSIQQSNAQQGSRTATSPSFHGTRREQQFDRTIRQGNAVSREEVHKIRQEFEQERVKHEEVLTENMKRMESLNEKVQRLMAERQNYDLQFTDSKEQLINAKEELHAAKEECQALRRINKQLVDANNALKKKLSSLESSTKTLKENHEAIGKTQPNVNISKEIYTDIERFIKTRVEEFTHQLKSQRMNQKLQQTIEAFLEQMLNINSVSVNQFKKHTRSTYQTDSSHVKDTSKPPNPLSISNIERIKLDKSLQKLRNIEKQQGWNDQAYEVSRRISQFRGNQRGQRNERNFNRSTINGNLSMLSTGPENKRQQNRSKSRGRRRIFE